VLAQFTKAGAETVGFDIYPDKGTTGHPSPQPIKITAKVDDGQTITALIMPMLAPKD